MKKLFLVCIAILAITSVPTIIAKPVNFQEADSVGKTIRDLLGCPGGDNKCFSGKISYKGVSFEGTWYLE